MTKAILFGSIGSVVETSEIQRKAFNDAFTDVGLDWYWDQDSYASMLAASGGKNRVQNYARSRGQTVDAAAVHSKKTELFHEALRNDFPDLRAGVFDVISYARKNVCSLGLVTTTEQETAELIAASVAKMTGSTFDLVTFRDQSRPGKPDPAVYQHALVALQVGPKDTIAIEDNADGVKAAKAAGITAIGFPGENTRAEDFLGADALVEGNILEALRDGCITRTGPAT